MAALLHVIWYSETLLQGKTISEFELIGRLLSGSSSNHLGVTDYVAM